MSQPNKIFRFRFYDNNITPESFSLKEIGSVLIAIEDSIKAIVDLKYPNINLDDIKLSLIAIENKSEGLTISTVDSPAESIDAFLFWGGSINQNNYVNLPEKAYNGYKIIYNLTEKKQCNAELIHSEKQICNISYTVPLIKLESVLIKIDTTIYGELIKVGGDKAKVWIELTNGNPLNFFISKEDATKLSPNLYKLVGLKGQAKWNPQSNYITAFKLYDIVDFKQGSVSRAFKELREITSGVWDKYNSNDDITKAIGR